MQKLVVSGGERTDSLLHRAVSTTTMELVEQVSAEHRVFDEAVQRIGRPFSDCPNELWSCAV